jgi:hypothetical protein
MFCNKRQTLTNEMSSLKLRRTTMSFQFEKQSISFPYKNL